MDTFSWFGTKGFNSASLSSSSIVLNKTAFRRRLSCQGDAS